MRIQRLELTGFKSFCDKMSLDLRAPITGVVGPNGCGKSNIVDSLRWAMGEQSARHLRGKTMEDVIFNGSESRGPAGMAEVSVTFQNDGLVPIEYLDYAEIMVTRRLYRDGTSEYLINKTPVRLRDITNLFLGTGVGTKAYSIIEQGRIGLIVSARPEDRRHFIEEAAGITKFQRKKKAAERRMEATRQNLLRVSDVLEEIGKRLGSLRRQARKAERYKRYRDEMRDIELRSVTHRYLETLALLKYLAGEIAGLEQQRRGADHELEQTELRLSEARLRAGESEHALSALQEELYALDNRIKLAENDILHHTHEADDLEKRADEAQHEAEGLKRQLALARDELERGRDDAEAMGRQKAELDAVLHQRTAELSRRRAEQQEVMAALEAERAALGRAERVQAESAATRRALLQRREDLQERLQRRHDELARIEALEQELRASATTLDGELVDLQQQVERLELRREEIRERLDALGDEVQRGETELEVVRTELHRRRSRLTSLQEIEQRYEGFSRGTRAVMKTLNGTAQERGILGLVADKIEAPDRYLPALEAVLGQRLGTIIVEDDRVGVEAIEFLKHEAKGRSSFINRAASRGIALDEAPVGFVWQPGGEGGGEALSAAGEGGAAVSGPGVCGPMLGLIRVDGDFSRVAGRMLHDVVVVEDLHHALGVWDALPGKTLVTLEGEILGADGTLTGGSQDAELSGVLRQKREIKELRGIIAELEQQYQDALDRHVALKTEQATLEQALERVTQQGHQEDKAILTREKDRSRVESELSALSVRREELRRELSRVEEQRRSIDDEELTQGALVAQADQDAQVAADMRYLLGREIQRLGGGVERAAARVTDVKVQVAQVEAQLRSVKVGIRRMEELQTERAERIQRLISGSDKGLNRAKELRRQVEELKVTLEQQVGQRAAAQERMELSRVRHEEQLAGVGEMELKVKQARAEAATLGEELAARQVRLSELRLSRQHLEEQIWDRYREELRFVAGEYHMAPAVTEEELARLDQLRQLIERMGEINLTAIDEYNELEERHTYLANQKNDLEQALGALQRAIQKINRTSRKRFKETFEAVNARFQQVFPRLFNGGRAYLSLTDEQNLLETGVEVVAQPPGKKLQSIELLSGGEKALTAVSLIFAMFLVKPTPFCLLDEVDAPLDEANVERYGNMIREMSADSQFILITHNRRTMEKSSRLYGVTMEEAGVSRLVSVNLSDGEALVND